MKITALESLGNFLERTPTTHQVQLTSSVETITPQIAKKYLETNLENQRNITESHLSFVRQQMMQEQWQLTGQPIIFDSKGRLIDGQHRLLALIAENKSVQFLVVRGAPPSSFMVIDTGKSRSNGNILAINKVLNYNTVAASVRGVLTYRKALSVTIAYGDNKEKKRFGSLNRQWRPSSTDIIKEYESNSDKYDYAARIAVSTRGRIPVSIVGTVASLAIVEAGHSYNDVSDFWESFYKGTGLCEGDPVLALRNRLASNSLSQAKLPHATITLLCVKAWNSYIAGGAIKVLRVTEGEGAIKVL